MNIKDIENIKYFDKGHRGLLFKGIYKKKKVILKTKLAKSKATERIENEANFLKILNKKNIGPKFLHYNKKRDVLVYEYVDGEFFPIFIRHLDKKNKNLIKKIIKQVFIQCFRMDKLKINKEEMHHPYKHIVIEAKTKKPVLLDFERCHKSKEPVNTTQFSSYIISGHMMDLLKEKGIKVDKEKVIAAAKRYKKDTSKKNLDKIIKEIK